MDRLDVGSQLDMDAVYEREGDAPLRALQAGRAIDGVAAPAAGEDSEHIRSTLSGVVWTPSMRRMYTLLKKCDTPLPRPYSYSSPSVTLLEIGIFTRGKLP